MNSNPLKAHFRQPSTYVRLPTKGIWYGDGDVNMTEDGEVAVYALTARDDILLNTPDAMLNGQALEKVILNCVPDIKNVKRLLIPDLENIFVAIKSASNNGKLDYDRKCPNCQHENSFELNCQAMLDRSTMIDESDTMIRFGDNLVLHIRPYDFEMRQLFIKREFEEERALRALESNNKDMDELIKASILSESVDKLSRITFDLVSRSITKIVMIKENVEVTDRAHISEWLAEISKPQADIVIESVNKLNQTGVQKKVTVQCTSCDHQWEDEIGFDPTSFFGKRS